MTLSLGAIMFRRLSLAALAALLCASQARAADPKPAKPPPAKAPAQAPAQAPAATSDAATFDLKELSLAGYLGGEFGDLDLFSLRADASLPVKALSPTVRLHGVASLGYGHGSRSVTLGSATWNMVTLVPAARFQARVAPHFELYGDLGLGLYLGFASSEVTIPGFPPFIPEQQVTSSSTNFGVMMRIAAGALYELTPKVKLAAEMGINPYFGDASTTNFVLLVGAQFKL
jgi:opacity protein-like surface antigen